MPASRPSICAAKRSSAAAMLSFFPLTAPFAFSQFFNNTPPPPPEGDDRARPKKGFIKQNRAQSRLIVPNQGRVKPRRTEFGHFPRF